MKIVKVDEGLGIAFGWAVISKVDGEPFFDSQGDYVPEDVVLKAAAGFMAGERKARVMHQGSARGTVLFALPLTTDIAKALGIATDKTGLVIGMKLDPAALARIRSGEYEGFSIGGSGYREAV